MSFYEIRQYINSLFKSILLKELLTHSQFGVYLNRKKSGIKLLLVSAWILNFLGVKNSGISTTKTSWITWKKIGRTICMTFQVQGGYFLSKISIGYNTEIPWNQERNHLLLRNRNSAIFVDLGVSACFPVRYLVFCHWISAVSPFRPSWSRNPRTELSLAYDM